MAGPWERYQGQEGPWQRYATTPEAAPDPYSDTYFAQGTSGLNEGIGGMLGAPVDLMNSAIGLGMKGVNAIAGTDLKPSDKPFLGSRYINEAMGDVGAIQPPTQDRGKQVLRRVAQSVGSSVVPAMGAAGGAVAPLKTAAGILAPALAGGGAAAASQQILPGNQTAETMAELVASLGTAGAQSYLRQRAADQAARATVPTVDELKAQAGSLYDEAEKTGVTANRTQTFKLHQKMRNIASSEGLISPTGRVSNAYPKASEALRMTEDYSKGTMTVPQMKAVRKTLSDAANSADGSEGRIASKMLEEFDDFSSRLAPPLEKAKGIYHSAMKGKKLEQVKELAGSRAGQFSGSGYENALRTEYRGLERNMIKGNERGWTDAEKAAVSKVAQGTTGANIARGVGKLAPTGAVSYGVTAGVPFAIGNTIGGPMLGGAAALGTGLTGFAGRGIATKMGLNAAEQAELLVRNQGLLPKGLLDPDTYRILTGVLATNAANSANHRPR